MTSVVQRRRPPGGGRQPWSWNPDDVVRSYLRPGERVVLAEARSRRAWLVDHAWQPVVAILVFAVCASSGSDPLLVVGLVVLVVVGSLLAVQGTRAWFTRYVLTDLRVLRVSGVLDRRAEFIPWAKVTDVGFSETFFQHLMGTATIRIESANERSGFRSMHDVVDPHRFYQQLVEMVDLRHGRVGGFE